MKLREKFKPCWIFLYDIGVVLNLFPERHGISAKKDMDDCDTPPEQGTFPVESISLSERNCQLEPTAQFGSANACKIAT